MQFGTNLVRNPREFRTAGTQVKGTITQVLLLRVVIDGATVDSLATTLDGRIYALDDRAKVQIRNPQVPVVLGILK